MNQQMELSTPLSGTIVLGQIPMFLCKVLIVKSLIGWWLSHPSEKYESVGIMKFPIYGKIRFMFQTTNQQSLKLGNSHFNLENLNEALDNS